MAATWTSSWITLRSAPRIRSLQDITRPARAFSVALPAAAAGQRSGRTGHSPARRWLDAALRTAAPGRPAGLASSCGSKMKAAIRPLPSKTAPARWWSPAPAQIGAEVVVTASTGNAGAALAGMAAAVGQKAVIFAPRTAPPAKVAQLLDLWRAGDPGGWQLRRGL